MDEKNILPIDTIKQMLERANTLLASVNDCVMMIKLPVVDIKDKEQNNIKAQLVLMTDELAIIDSKLKEAKVETEEAKGFFEIYAQAKQRFEPILEVIKTKEVLKLVKEIKEDIKAKIAADQVNSLISQIEDEYGVDAKDVKVVPINTAKKPIGIILFEVIINLVLNVLIMFSFANFISWGNWDSIGNILLFASYLTSIEILLKIIIERFFVKYIIKTLGIILYIPLVISIAIAAIFPIWVHIDSYVSFIFVSVLAYTIRRFMIGYIGEKIIKKGRKKGGENQSKKSS